MFKQIASLALVTVAAPLFAQDDRGFDEPSRAEHIRHAYADVLRVDPVVEYVRVNRPREVCEDEEVVRVERERGNTAAGTIVGAVIGGVLGNQVGKGNGRRAATAAGAVIGGAIGHRVDRDNNPVREVREIQTHCQVVDEVREEERVLGYDVEYRYRGEVFVSRMQNDPGDRVRVRVAVTPVE